MDTVLKVIGHFDCVKKIIWEILIFIATPIVNTVTKWASFVLSRIVGQPKRPLTMPDFEDVDGQDEVMISDGEDEEVDENIQDNVPVGHQCETCGRVLSNRGNLKRHQLIHSNEKPFVCEVCGVAFRQSNHLKRHNVMKHLGEEPALICAICRKGFHQNSDLQRHGQYHNGEKPFYCTHCLKRFTLKGNLKQHQRVHRNII